MNEIKGINNAVVLNVKNIYNIFLLEKKITTRLFLYTNRRSQLQSYDELGVYRSQ
jgi:hypothetical protein